jgi:hypothetical protein
MMERISSRAVDAIRHLINDLVAGDYAAIAADGRIGRLTEVELRRAIVEYGKTLVSLPDGGDLVADVYPSNTDPRASAVDLALWTAEEGQSDLTLSVTVVEGDDGPTVSIDDLHTL